MNSIKNSPTKQANEDDDNDEIQYKYNPTREYEIQKEVERYRQKLQDNLLKMINEEKQKEEERETFFKNITEEEERKKAEILINLERSESSRKVVSLKQ
jgi:rubrerythrin